VKLKIIIFLYSLFFIHYSFSPLVFAAPAACHCNDPNKCYADGCCPKPMPNGEFDEGYYNDVCNDKGSLHYTIPSSGEIDPFFCHEHTPDCCFDLKRFKDNRACCWNEIGFCPKSLCYDGSHKCGYYWKYHSELGDNFPISWGCVKMFDETRTENLYGSLPPNYTGDTQPSPTRAPTQTPTKPNPTSTPKPQPTTVRPQPSTNQQPTNTPTLIVTQGVPTGTPPPANLTPMTMNTDNPYRINSPTPYRQTVNPLSFNLPTVNMLPLKNSLKLGVIQSTRFFNLFSFTFNQITSLDKKLETTINDLLPDIKK